MAPHRQTHFRSVYARAVLALRHATAGELGSSDPAFDGPAGVVPAAAPRQICAGVCPGEIPHHDGRSGCRRATATGCPKAHETRPFPEKHEPRRITRIVECLDGSDHAAGASSLANGLPENLQPRAGTSTSPSPLPY